MTKLPPPTSALLTLALVGLSTTALGQGPGPAVTATAAAELSVPSESDPGAQSLDDVLEGLDKTGSPARPPKSPAPSTPEVLDDDRAAPNYEGRTGEAVGAGDVLIWVPRILLYPVHLVLDYVVRRPIVWAITRAEANSLFARVEQALTFFNGKATLFPTVLADFGLNPAVGLAYTHADLFADGNTFDVSVSFANPEDWLRVAVRNEQIIFGDDSGLFTLHAEFLRRPDQPFYGLGADTSTLDERIYAIERVEFGFELAGTLYELNRILLSTRIRTVQLSANGADRPRLGTELNLDGEPLRRLGAIAYFDPETIPGFRERYELLEHRIHLMLDSRSADTQFDGGTGLRFETFGSFEWDPTDPSLNFVRVGGEASAFYDFSGRGHVAGLRAYGEFLFDAIPGQRIPFVELPMLGGNEVMRGYLPGRFVGQYAVALSGTYRYPVWSLIDAEIFGSIGNVFGAPDRIDGVELDVGSQRFSFKRLYAAGGMGLRTNIDRDTALSILLGFGTKRFDSGYGIDSIRFTFGVTQGF